MTDCFLGDAFGILSCPFLEYCSAVLFSAADTHLKLLDCGLDFVLPVLESVDSVEFGCICILNYYSNYTVISGASFLNSGCV